MAPINMNKTTQFSPVTFLILACLLFPGVIRLYADEARIIDHQDVDITELSEEQIKHAKETLHIAYGHTSHGSQLTTGMDRLVGFANGGGKGLALSTDIFAWNNGGFGGALDLHDYAMGGDVGTWPQWRNNTLEYLNNSNNADVNVIVWSWCGQVDGKYASGTLESEYLEPMTVLEAAYPDVVFVYMTGHVDHKDDANNKAANQMIRDYCLVNNKVLYDFADIESYDPDGVFYEFPHDGCEYYASVEGAELGNWAIEWQDSHSEGVDWYSCSSAHSQALNANQKAYAAWALWCAIAERISGQDLVWAGYDVIDRSNVDTGNWLGWLDIAQSPWIYDYSLSAWIYVSEIHVSPTGGWVYFPSSRIN